MNDYPDAFITKRVKSRKEHWCCECMSIIKKGDQYQYSSGIWDEPQSYKQCVKCYEIFTLTSDADFCFLAEWFHQQIYQGYDINDVIAEYSEKWSLKNGELNRLLKEGSL